MKTNKPTAENKRRANDAALRSIAYGAMAKAFGYPTPGTRTDVLDAMESIRPDVAALGETAAAACSTLVESLRNLRDAQLEAEYISTFTHVCAADCNPCETSYLCKHLFQVSQTLAELNGLYHAFGVEPAGERPDHISVQLEFLSYLTYREAGEEMRGEAERAEESRKARRLFLERHVGRWFRTFLFLVRRKARNGPYHAVADFCEALLSSDAEFVGARTAECSFAGSLPLPVWDVHDDPKTAPKEQVK